jgi:hypothetical protein
MSYRIVAVPEDKINDLPKGTDLLEVPTGSAGENLVLNVDTQYGPLQMRVYEGDEGLQVTAEVPTDTPWVINGIPVSGYYVLDSEKVHFGSLSRVNSYGHDDATDAAKRTVKKVCMEAVHNLTPSQQEALIRSRQIQKHYARIRLADAAAELAKQYNAL